MERPLGNRIKLKAVELTEALCRENHAYWEDQMGASENDEKFDEARTMTSTVLPAHTFAHLKDDFSPLKKIFGYNETLGMFIDTDTGIVAKKFRGADVPDFGHMTSSDKLGHDVFTFAYLGVHNPYHRMGDDLPIRPFGLYLKKEIEEFCFCHGSPCDVVKSNERVDQRKLKHYYLLADSLRELKAMEIAGASEIPNAWYNYGNPEEWAATKDYGKNLFKRQGEFRYYKRIAPEAVAAILWPSFVSRVDDDGIPMPSDDQELIDAFRRAYPDISVVRYGHDDGNQQDWELTLVEASYLTTRYHLKHGVFPKSAALAIDK